MGAYHRFIGKFVYVLVRYDDDYPFYIGYTFNIKRRKVEHKDKKQGTGFANSIPKYLRSNYKMIVYDLSQFDELSREDVRIFESYVTRNFGAVWSKPKKLSPNEEERLQEILEIIGDIQPKTFEQIEMERLGKKIDWCW